MDKITSKERIRCAFEHKPADRVPILEAPWPATLERWHRESLPEDVPWWQYFDVDNLVTIEVDNSPQYPQEVIEETEEYKIVKTQWGVTLKDKKHTASVPQFLDFTITSPEKWQQAKYRIKPTKDRINWDLLKKEYPKWRQQGTWIQAFLWFGFDVTHSWAVGTERLLMALLENPEWCQDMFNHCLEIDLILFEEIWNAGYEFDSIFWCDDMGYKLNQFFSVDMYRQFLKPYHKKAADWAHSKGIKVHLHSCGDIRPFVPDLINLGIDCLNPLEVKAGVDPIELKKRYGDKLALHGGINALSWHDKEKITNEIQQVVPIMKENGGYIFSTDHSIPSSVSFEDYREIIELVKNVGSF
jgi:uroporphyrinogen decarboxylase